jgi:signal transduction histidine kinase
MGGYRDRARGASILVVLAVLLLAGSAGGAEQSSITVFDRADFLLSKEQRPPADSSAWKPVSLPDQWRHRMPDGTEGQGWYRIRFRLEERLASVHTAGITHPRANRTDFFVNGKLLGGAGELIAGGRGSARGAGKASRPSFGTPLHVMVPHSLLRPGENVIHVRVHATSSGPFMHGLPQVKFGDATALRRPYHASNEFGFGAQRTFFAMALVSGIITLFLWLARRGDKVIFWYSVACLTWGIVSIPRLALRWVDVFAPVVPVLSWFLNYGLVVPIMILCLRTVNLRWPWFETALWVFLVIETAFPLWVTAETQQWYLAWDTVNTVLLLAGLSIILRYARRPLRWSEHLQIAAMLLMAALMFFEVARYLEWVYVDFKAIRHYHVPLMLLAIGAVIFERHVLAVQRTEQANAKLERRVAEKAREIESTLQHVEMAKREQALAEERRRILADMHEGLGASLGRLVRHAHSGGADRASIERRIQDAIQELRVAVDALQPHEGDLAAVFGSLRYRLDSLIREAGVHLVWEVGELPEVAGLAPATVFAIQRILLEAFTNAVKHSGASHINFTASARGPRGITIRIEDDGKGFDAQHVPASFGLSSMQTRAGRIGGAVEIRSRPGAGTVVQLDLPTSLSSKTVLACEEPASSHESISAPGLAS